jgi:hypothetical protein
MGDDQFFEGAQVRFRRTEGGPQKFFIPFILILFGLLSHLPI